MIRSEMNQLDKEMENQNRNNDTATMESDQNDMNQNWHDSFEKECKNINISFEKP